MITARWGRLARTGWLATTLALVIALVAGSWANYRGTRDAASALTRGQADLLAAAVRENFVQQSATPGAAMLDTLLAEHAGAGLRFIALFDTAGRVTLSAGQPVLPPAPPSQPSFTRGPLQQTGDRLRFFMPRPPTFTEIAAQDAARRARGQDPATRRGRPPQRRWVLLEMEPVLAAALENRAARSFGLAVAGAMILTLAALLFWRTSEQYQRALMRLEEQRRLGLLGEMSAVLAHEIRNPLASLKGNAQLLVERLPAGSREHARADRVIVEATRLEALTTDLLDFARSAPLHKEPADPMGVLRTSIADVSDDGFDVDNAGAPAHWPMDAARVRHALVNVLQNARQATAEGTRPRVRASLEHGVLVYQVRDFGPGLPAGSETRIFDPFFTTRTNGTGLGLAVARRVTEMHGGSLTARNHENGGAEFRIELPAAGG